MAKKPLQPIRWTVFLASQEFHKTGNRIREGLRAHGIEAGNDEKYSSQQIARASFDHDALEASAKKAKWQQQIDEAEEAKMRRAELSGSLVPIGAVREWTSDILTRVVSVIRHSPLSEQSKDQILYDLREHTVPQMSVA